MVVSTREESLTFWTELNENSPESKWVHALPVGTWKHPVLGEVSHDLNDIQLFADNVNHGVRGIDPYVNYDHREKGGDAAGWVKQADAQQDGLWLLVEWTKKAAEKLKNKEYRYWSTEFLPLWEDPHTGQKHRNVIVGGALTNVPFLKNLVPVNLNEFQGNQESKENTMDREKLIGLLELSEDATDEQIEQAIKDTKTKAEDEPKTIDLSKLKVEQDGTKVKVTHPDIEEDEFTFEVKATKQEDGEKELQKLAEDNPAVARLMEQQEQDRKNIRELQAAARLSEIDSSLNEIGGGKKALPPVVKDKLRKTMARLPVELSEGINEALIELHKVGFVELGEGGSRRPDPKGDGGSDDAVDAFMDKVDEVREEDEDLSYSDAVHQVSLSEPDLWEAYNEAMESGVVVE